MVTKRELEWAQFYAVWMVRSKIQGVEWNHGTKRFSVTTKKWKLLFNALYLAWNGYVAVFTVSRFYTASKEADKSNTKSLLEIAYMGMMTADVAIFGMNTAFALSRNKLTTLVNQLIVFNNKPGRKTEPTRRESIIKFLQYFLLTAAALAIPFFIITEYLSFAKTGSAWSVFGFLKILPHSILNSATTIPVFGLMQICLMLFFASVFDTLPKEKVDEDFLMQTLHDYKCLAILCNSFNDGYCRVFVPTVKYLVGTTGLSFVYIAIRASAVSEVPGLPLLCFFIGIYLLCAVNLGTSAMSNLWMVSSKFLLKMDQQCRQFDGNRETRKFLMATVKSVLPLRLYVGGMYYMEGEAKLTFMQFLIFALVNMLLLK